MRRRQILAQPQLDRAGRQAAAVEQALKRGGIAPIKPSSSKVEAMASKAQSDWHRHLTGFPMHYFNGNQHCPLGCGRFIERGMVMHLRYCKRNPNRASS